MPEPTSRSVSEPAITAMAQGKETFSAGCRWKRTGLHGGQAIPARRRAAAAAPQKGCGQLESCHTLRAERAVCCQIDDDRGRRLTLSAFWRTLSPLLQLGASAHHHFDLLDLASANTPDHSSPASNEACHACLLDADAYELCRRPPASCDDDDRAGVKHRGCAKGGNSP